MTLVSTSDSELLNDTQDGDRWLDRLMHITEVPKLLPRRKDGTRVHIQTIYRWISQGRNGVKLRRVTVAGRVFTTPEWVEDYLLEVSEAKRSPKRDA